MSTKLTEIVYLATVELEWIAVNNDVGVNNSCTIGGRSGDPCEFMATRAAHADSTDGLGAGRRAFWPIAGEREL